jgi:hypothetical protein
MSYIKLAYSLILSGILVVGPYILGAVGIFLIVQSIVMDATLLPVAMMVAGVILLFFCAWGVFGKK